MRRRPPKKSASRKKKRALKFSRARKPAQLPRQKPKPAKKRRKKHWPRRKLAKKPASWLRQKRNGSPTNSSGQKEYVWLKNAPGKRNANAPRSKPNASPKRNVLS